MKLKVSRSPAGPWTDFFSFRSQSKDDKARYDLPMSSYGVDNDVWFQV